MSLLIETRSLTRLYGTVIGVNDVSLELERGVHGLLGPNGAGKSTLLKLITGQLRPTEGRVRVLGEDPWNNTALLRRIGLCPEQDALYPYLTGLEFVALLTRLHGFDPPEARRRAERALERVGATEFMQRKIETYSRGMRQRTKVAQALAHEPEFLILDEPLNGTDPIGRREMMDLVIALGRGGTSILVASHVMHEVQAMTERFLLIWGGRVLASGAVREIRALMDEYPHRITIRCEGARALAQRMVGEAAVLGVELDEAAGELVVRTRDPKAFYAALPAMTREAKARVSEFHSPDDSLDAVFGYLVGGDA